MQSFAPVLSFNTNHTRVHVLSICLFAFIHDNWERPDTTRFCLAGVQDEAKRPMHVWQWEEIQKVLRRQRRRRLRQRDALQVCRISVTYDYENEKQALWHSRVIPCDSDQIPCGHWCGHL